MRTPAWRALPVLLVAACSSGPQAVCAPGEQVACACPGSTVTGAQVCDASGGGFGACTGCPTGGGDGNLPPDAAGGRDAATGDGSIDQAGGDRSVPDLAGLDGAPDAPIGDASAGDASAGDAAGLDLAAPDLAGVDLRGPTCGNGSCMPNQACCLVPDDGGVVGATCLAACTYDGGSFYPGSCAGPADCPGVARPAGGCCAGQGNIPTGDGGTKMAPAQAECADPCIGYWEQTLNGQVNAEESQLCRTQADCAGYSGTLVVVGLGSFAGPFDDCCSFRNGPPERACAPSQAVQLLPNLFDCF